jgi:phosphatidylserine decarboxylase
LVLTIFISSLCLGCGILSLLAFKCRILLRIGFFSGLAIGFLTGIISYVFYHTVAFMPLQITLIFECIIIVVITTIVVAFRFYRNPERTVPSYSNIIISPADGTIRYVKRIKRGNIPFSEKKKNRYKLKELLKTNILKGDAYLIGIEMNILDVHVNRIPVTGTLTLLKHSKGIFKSLRDIDSIFENERVTSIIDTGHFQIAVVQIASRLVRRIVSYLVEGDSVLIGQRMGMIKFGSQVDIVIPVLPDMMIGVNEGDLVKAASTILCKYEIDASIEESN